MSNLTFQYSPYFILLCILLGLVFAFTLYFRDKKFQEHGKWLPLVLGLLRFLAITGLSFLLLVPLLKSIFEETKNPVIVVARDVSSSVNDLADRTFEEGLVTLKNDLEKDFQVDEYTFSNDLYAAVPDSNNVKSTNLEKVFTELDELYINQNVGAIIIATDGIYNEGKNPLYLNNNISAPVYPIALGDTIERKDIVLKRTLNNDIVFLGDKFSVLIDIEAINSAGESSRLTISRYEEDGKLTSLQSKVIRIDDNDFFKTEEIILEANQSGVIRYVASLSGINGEISKRNNRKDIFIEVLDSRQKILLLANSPHPDVSAFKHIIENNKNYELSTSFLNKEDIPNEQFDLVILHNLPSSKKDITQILNRSNIKNAARLFIFGSQTSQSKFNQVQSVFSVEGSSNSLNEVQATLSSGFSLFKISDALSTEIRNYPPMVSPFGNYKLSPNAVVLLKQKIGKVETEYPLIALNDQGGIKTGVIAGEGLWKWRLFNFLQKSHYDEISELLNKTLQYLTLKEDKRKFRASPAQNIFKENENIVFSAEMYNDSYEKINEADVNLAITNSAGNSFSFTFSKRADYYFLDARQFPAGNYRYNASSMYNGKKVEQSGRFSVESIQLESFDLTARHDLLGTLASNYGGQLIKPENTGELIEIIKNNNQIKPTVYASTRTNKLMDQKWIFFLLFGFLAIEWFLRRYFGSY